MAAKERPPVVPAKAASLLDKIIDQSEAQTVNTLTNEQTDEQINLLTKEPEPLTHQSEHDTIDLLTNQQVNKFVNKRINKPTNKRTNKQMNTLTDEQIDPFTNLLVNKLTAEYPDHEGETLKLIAGRVPESVAARYDTVCKIMMPNADKQDVLTEALKFFIEHMAGQAAAGEIKLKL